MKRKVQVWITDGKHVLLFRLIPERGSLWQPITGGVDSGESEWMAAVREVHEEAGWELSASDAIWIPLNFVCSFEGRWGVAQETTFGLRLQEKRKPDLNSNPGKREHTTAKWVSFREANRRIVYPNQHEALMELQRKILNEN